MQKRISWRVELRMRRSALAKVRALTVFASPSGWSRKELSDHVADLAGRVVEAVRAAENEYGIGVWSIRIALPPLPAGVSPVKVASAVTEALDGTGVGLHATVHVADGDKRLPELVEALASYPTYASIAVRGDTVEAAHVVVRKLGLTDPLAATRVAVTLGGSTLTPYFPASVNWEHTPGVAVAMLYVREFRRSLTEGRPDYALEAVSRACDLAKDVSRRCGLSFLGVDLSLSPWMSDSVGELIEELSGGAGWGLTALKAILRANALVRSLRDALTSFGARTTGFNEVMLPVAEDDILKARVKNGTLRLNDLVMYTSVCVAGLDMVVLPESADESFIRSLLEAVGAIARARGKALGARLIVYPGVRPGDVVDLGRFGKTPVIEV